MHDLVAGLAEDVPPLPHARYRLVAATLTASQRHPVGDVVGDLLVRPRSAYGRDRRGRELFPGADVLHVGQDRPLRAAQPPGGPPGDARLARMTAQTTAERELRAEATIAAPPDRVWALISDVSRMPDWSPELVRMLPLKRGGMRRRAVVPRASTGARRSCGPPATWSPSSSRGARLAWDTTSSGARWIWEVTPAGEGTHVVHRRPVPARLTLLGSVFARLFLGGIEDHADELEAGMARTVGPAQGRRGALSRAVLRRPRRPRRPAA